MQAARISDRPARDADAANASPNSGRGQTEQPPAASDSGRTGQGGPARQAEETAGDGSRAGSAGLGWLARRLKLRSSATRSGLGRYALALIFVLTAYLVTVLLEIGTGKFAPFPFYAAVVASAWLGVGPGVLAVALSAVSAADFWTPTRYSLYLKSVDVPSFAAFIVFALMSLAWSAQRRRAQHALEETVQQRTADLVQANTALKAEMAERAATERALRDAEAELARTLRLATIAEFAAAIAHEINQPLAAITANGSACLRSLQRDPPLLDNAREAASCIVADGHRAAAVIARTRSLFNKEQPQQELLGLNEVIRYVLELSRGAIERQRVAIHAELDHPGPLVMADPVQLQQVMVNLVANALDAMERTAEGQRVLTLRSRVERDKVTVTVEDTGTGLAAGQIDRIFDNFYTTKPGGIGIGLAISRSIIEAHGGTIWAAPGTPTGARVGFDLPLAPAADG